MELRDVDSGSKLNERLRTDETVESMHSRHLPAEKWETKCPVLQLIIFSCYSNVFQFLCQDTWIMSQISDISYRNRTTEKFGIVGEVMIS